MRLIGAIILAIVIGACGQGAAPTPTPATNVPCGPSEVLTRHEHAHLTILIRGQIKTLPALVGITTQICWLHKHDTSGIIHIEAGDNRKSIQATVNQQPYAGAPETIVLKNREDIVLQLGPPFLQIAPYVWPPGY